MRMPYGYRRYIRSYIPQLANLTNLMDHQLLPLFNATPGGPGRQYQARDLDVTWPPNNDGLHIGNQRIIPKWFH